MNIAVGLVVLVVVLFFILTSIVKILMEYERGVIFRLGRYSRTGGPGLTLLIPFIEQMRRVELRLVTMDVPPQDVITRDNVSVKVSAVVYFRVIKPEDAVINVEDYLYATSQLAQTTLRSILGQAEMDELLSARDKINEELQTILDRQTENWGIKVATVEVKHVDLPQEMQRAMARQAEANASGGPKSSMPRVNIKRPRAWPRRHRSSPFIPRPCNYGSYRRSVKWPRKQFRPSCSPFRSICSPPSWRNNQPAVGSGGNGEPQG